MTIWKGLRNLFAGNLPQVRYEDRLAAKEMAMVSVQFLNPQFAIQQIIAYAKKQASLEA